jgi:hypothetical protein
MTPAAVLRELVPDPPPDPPAPPGYAVVDEVLAGGLPHRLRFGGRAAAVVLPTGLARTWADADPLAVADRSADDAADPAAAPPPGPAPRLVVFGPGGAVLGVAVFRGAGRPQVLPAAGPAAVEVVPLAWDIRAGTVRGRGDWGGRVRFAWRAADAPTADYLPPVPHPYTVARLGTGRRTVLLRSPRVWLGDWFDRRRLLARRKGAP